MSDTSFSMVFLAIGIATFWYGIQTYRKSKESMNWPTVSGEITSSEVERKLSTSSSGSKYNYYPQIEYTYQIGNRSYSSNRVSTLDYGTSNPNGHARKITTRYRIGRKVKVYYNPENSNEAVLEPGASMGSMAILAVGITFTITGFLLLIFK